MKPEKKLTTRQQAQEQQTTQEQQHAQLQAGREFATVEEMLRHDALHTPVPPAIAHRLQQSVSELPPAPARSWWRRLLGS